MSPISTPIPLTQAAHCPRCDSQILPGAKFCTNCGHALGGGGSSARAWTIVLACFLTVAAVLAGLSAAGVVKLSGSRSGGEVARARGVEPESGVTRAQGATPDSGLVKAHGKPSAGVTVAQAPENVEMPKEIRDWLEHLRKCEERRVAITQDHLTTMMVSLMQMQQAGASEELNRMMNGDPNAPDPPPPTKSFRDETEQLQKEWAELDRQFASLPPPGECVPIRDDYQKTVRETANMMGELMGALDNAAADPKAALAALYKMQGSSKGRIDAAARATDQGVAAICAKYRTPKWFNIVEDMGGSMVSQFKF